VPDSICEYNREVSDINDVLIETHECIEFNSYLKHITLVPIEIVYTIINPTSNTTDGAEVNRWYRNHLSHEQYNLPSFPVYENLVRIQNVFHIQ